MEKIKQFVFHRFQLLFTVLVFTGCCLFMLMIRLKLTQSFFYLFLVWNLFLAAIPMIITGYLSHRKKVTWYTLGISFLLWILFLPNAPYIVTDAIHLRLSETTLLLFDSVLVGIFAFAGLLFYCISLRDMLELLSERLSKQRLRLIQNSVPFAVGFGIYLGRFLRWNSWDIIGSPRVLVNDIFEIVRFPMEHSTAWLITLGFGFGLHVIYKLFLTIRYLK